ncbi:YolD-like family protein [Bacillus sp. V2I10]|uniref:YolD-like family protein n=1 Tax=Bacillus sp. V2I10 TaxID=3042276 RepID=UPI0035934063
MLAVPQIEEMEQLIISSLENNYLLEIITWKGGFFTSRVGIVTKVDPILKTIQIQDELDITINLDFFQIVEVKSKE